MFQKRNYDLKYINDWKCKRENKIKKLNKVMKACGCANGPAQFILMSSQPLPRQRIPVKYPQGLK